MRLLAVIILGIGPLFGGEWEISGDISTARVELQEVTFYGTEGSNAPAVSHNPTFWGTRAGGQIIWKNSVRVRDHILWGSKREEREISPFETVITPDGEIDGGGVEVFRLSFQQNDFDLMGGCGFTFCDGLSITPRAGYSFLYQSFGWESRFQTALTKQHFTTYFHGGVMEVAFRQQFRNALSVMITPLFGVYYADSVVCLRGELDMVGVYSWKNKSIGVGGFMDYLNYTPSVINPKAEGESVKLIHSNSFSYGIGGTIHFSTCF